MSLFADFVSKIQSNKDLSDVEKTKVLKNLNSLKEEKVHVLITGATGCGKSSTINALFDQEVAKVGQSSNPETMNIARYDFDNVILFDSPGLGDGNEADLRHAKNITNKLLEKKPNGDLLIDLVLVILDGSSRDLGTSYELINKVIIPNLGQDKSRLLIAINQADQAMKGRNWNQETNQPEQKLIDFLNEKAESTKNRIYEATKVNVEPIYYAAGYKDGDEQQYPWNLSKLLAHILKHTKEEKRIVFEKEINSNQKVWESDDRLENYQQQVKQSFLDSFIVNVSNGLGKAGEIVSNVAINVANSIVSGAKAIGGAIASTIGGFISRWF
jgi:predicted GTPase